jgi:hypothetical protein
LTRFSVLPAVKKRRKPKMAAQLPARRVRLPVQKPKMSPATDQLPTILPLALKGPKGLKTSLMARTSLPKKRRLRKSAKSKNFKMRCASRTKEVCLP